MFWALIIYSATTGIGMDIRVIPAYTEPACEQIKKKESKYIKETAKALDGYNIYLECEEFPCATIGGCTITLPPYITGLGPTD